MSNSRKTFSIILILSLILVGILLYPSYMRWSTKRAELAIEQKFYDLSHIVLDQHDCPAAMSEARSFLSRNSRAVPVWSILGACQFDMGEFDNAKVTFQKVLALEPEHAAAKNYLARMEFKEGEVVVTASELPFDRAQYELMTGFKFSSVLNFQKVVVRPSNIKKYLLATYTSNDSFSGTVSYLKSELQKQDPHFSVSTLKDMTIIGASNEAEIKIVTIENTKPVKVTTNYQKL